MRAGFVWVLAVLAAHAQTRRPDTVVVDASDFFEHMPKGTIITQAPSPEGGGRRNNTLPDGSWLFNNTALTVRSQAYVFAKAAIPQPGTYHLFVRSHGPADASFRVTVGEKQTQAVFGNEPLAWKAGGTFELKKGAVDVVLSRVVLGKTSGSTFDCLVLTRDPAFNEDNLRSHELPADVQLLKEYRIPRSSAVKFGDVDGDGRTDFFVLTPNYGGHMFSHDGRELWSYDNDQDGLRLRAEFEAPGLLWDFDRDGRAEAVHYRFTGGKEYLVIADGATGAEKHRIEWPTQPLPHVYNNFRLAVADFGGGYPNRLLVFTDSGGLITITAYTAALERLWQHTETRRKDHLGHYIYPVDLNRDGVDEVVASILALDSKGKLLWNRFDLLDDNHDHCDSFRFHDLDGDGLPELLAPVSEEGVMVFRPRDGSLLWRHPAEHTQQIEAGHFLGGVPGLHIAANARTYARNGEAGLGGQVHWFDAKGKLLSKWPANPLNGNPDFVKGDWRGNGTEELFWYKFRIAPDGRGVLSFKQDVYHMFDFMGTGAEQVICRGGGSLLVYGYRNAPRRPVKRPSSYWKRVANHTHY